MVNNSKIVAELELMRRDEVVASSQHSSIVLVFQFVAIGSCTLATTCIAEWRQEGSSNKFLNR